MGIFMYIVTRFDVDVEAPFPFFVWHVQLNVVLGVKKKLQHFTLSACPRRTANENNKIQHLQMVPMKIVGLLIARFKEI